MKFLIITILVFVQNAYGNIGLDWPSVQPANFGDLYVPDGFDSNDSVQIVGEGIFSNSCFRPANAKVTVNHTEGIINLEPKAYVYEGMCLQVLVPYTRVLNLGLLKPKTYRIVQGQDQLPMGSINIRKAKVSRADDYYYAPVDQAIFLSSGEGKKVILTGVFTNSCMTWQEIRVRIQEKVLVVQPIIQLRDDGSCEEGHFPYSEEKIVDRSVPKGRYLLHVRSMNGKAINNMVDIF